MTTKNYLKIGDILGSSKDPGHINEIMVASWSLGPPSDPYGHGTRDFSIPNGISLRIEKSPATPRIVQAAMAGTPFSEPFLMQEEVTSGGKMGPKLKFRLIKVYITKASVLAKGILEIRLDFDNIQIEHGSMGLPRIGWEVHAGRK